MVKIMRKFIVIEGKCPTWILLTLNEMRIKLCMKDFVIGGFTKTIHVKKQMSCIFVII